MEEEQRWIRITPGTGSRLAGQGRPELNQDAGAHGGGHHDPESVVAGPALEDILWPACLTLAPGGEQLRSAEDRDLHTAPQSLSSTRSESHCTARSR